MFQVLRVKIPGINPQVFSAGHGNDDTFTCFSTCACYKFFGGVSGLEDRGGGDNNIQFINIGRVGDKIF